MAQKSKTHYEEVPLEVAQQIAREQILPSQSQVARSGQLRGPVKKPSHKAPKTEIADERKDS